MALIKCEECGNMISDRASRCPKCGCPVVKMSAEGAPTPRVEEPVMEKPSVTPPPVPTPPPAPTTVAESKTQKQTQPAAQIVRPQPAPSEQVAQKPQDGLGKGKSIAIFLLSVALLVGIVLVLSPFIGVQEHSSTKDKNIVSEGDAAPEKVQDKENVHVEPYSTINGHEYVDLGLSVKWATCNVGASSPEEYGDYFAWGETSPKSEYTEKNCKTCGKNMGSIAGNSQYDAACANWGGPWRMPTNDEIHELVDRCAWVKIEGHNGCKVTGPNGNSIFFPSAGWRDEMSLYYAGESGGYWSATPDEDNAIGAYGLGFDNRLIASWDGRNRGMSVRPVTE